MRDDVSDLVGFLAVARTGSFTQAAKQLGVSQPALSLTLKQLEKRLGLRLLNRTTRSVTTTEAGERLLRSIAPHFDGIEAGLASVNELRDKPAGTLRITTGDQPAEGILAPAIAKLVKEYPDINVEIDVNSGFVDIVAERFDAGVRLGETIAQDMVSLRIGPDMRMAVIGSPAYFKSRKPPKTPHDLSAHNCINLRFSSKSGVSVWDFDHKGRDLNVRVGGQLVVNDIALAKIAAVEGAGLAYLPEDYVADVIKSGEAVRVLDSWCEPFSGYHLYYSSKRQHSAAFTLLVEALRYRGK